jgi:hypothetical protein
MQWGDLIDPDFVLFSIFDGDDIADLQRTEDGL